MLKRHCLFHPAVDRWHVKNGNKTGKYGDFHMLSQLSEMTQQNPPHLPVQLTASNLALSLTIDPRKKDGHGSQRPRQLQRGKHESLSRSARPGDPERQRHVREDEKKLGGQDG